MLTVTKLRSSEQWVVRPQPQPHARLRLFCFPYAGGGASIYRTWPKDLPPEVEVLAIQLPGREIRLHEPALTQLEPLLTILAEVLMPYLTTPFVFFGHSLGALISFELSRRLCQLGQRLPLHLFASGRAAPQIPDPTPPMCYLPEPEFIAELRRLNGTPEEVLRHDELRTLMLPLLRADFMINETYRYTLGPPLDCPISAFGGLSDHIVCEADLAAWQAQTSSTFTLRMFPGDHFFLRVVQADLLRAIQQDLAPHLRHQSFPGW
jgi:medium-chain acyl-[acyl-carrier-protein] hydrolase